MRSKVKHWIIPGFNRRDFKSTSWIYNAYLPDVLLIVKKLTRDAPEAEDLTADIFVILLQHQGAFESIRKLEYFLYTTARNVSLDYLRHQQVVKTKSPELIEHMLKMEEEAVRYAELNAAFQHLIHLAIETLPPQCKQVFLLCFTEQLRNAQIAAKLGISEKTVANHKIYAYKRMRMEIGRADHASMRAILGMILI